MDIKSLPAFSFLALFARWLLLPSVALLTGCTSLFFQPTKTRYPYLELDRLQAETVELRSSDQTKLSAWRISSVDARKNHPNIRRATDLKPDEVRGVALQFHGNAENMTSHYRYQLWLLFEGWDVLTFDYRGYGSSGGHPSDLEGVRADGAAAIRWAQTMAKEKNLPLVIFGQSLGASLLLTSLGDFDVKDVSQLKLLVLDSAFYSFRSIAREKLSEVWFLWPFQWLGWILVSDELSAARRLKRLDTPDTAASPRKLGPYATPAIFLHSESDPIVSNDQGARLFAIYPGEKLRWTTAEPGHVNTLFSEIYYDSKVEKENPLKDQTEAGAEIGTTARHREKLKARLRLLKGVTEPASK